MTKARQLKLNEVLEIVPERYSDERGFLSESYKTSTMKELGYDLTFVQDNHTYNTLTGVLRGLHFQKPPFAQDKLVRVVRGAIFDVVVDIRPGSPTYGDWVGLEVSAEKRNQVLVPKGFAHGYVTLEPDTDVIYKVTAEYTPEYDQSVYFNDPDIGIKWPLDDSEIKLSHRDKNAPLLANVDTGFDYGNVP